MTLREVFSSSSSKAFPSTPEDEDGSAAIFKDLTGEEDGGDRRLRFRGVFKVTIFIVTVSAESSEEVPLSKIDEDLSVE